MRKSAKSFLHSGVMIMGMLSATPAIGEVTALDRYVAAPDPSYRYELIETIPGDGYAAHVLEMTSQRWRDETEVDRPLWKHWLTVIAPEQVATSTALLIVGGGSNERKPRRGQILCWQWWPSRLDRSSRSCAWCRTNL